MISYKGLNFLSVCLTKIKKLAYFTIHLTFTTIYRLCGTLWSIHKSNCTILTNFYFYLRYFEKKKKKVSAKQKDPKPTLLKCSL